MGLRLGSLEGEEYYVTLPALDVEKKPIMEKNDKGVDVVKLNNIPYTISFKSQEHIKDILIDDFVKSVSRLESVSYYKVLEYLYDIGMVISSVASEKRKKVVEEFPGNFTELDLLSEKTYYRAKIFTFPAIEHILSLYNKQAEAVALELAAAHSNF